MDWPKRLQTKCLKLINPSSKDTPAADRKDLIPLVNITPPLQPKPKPKPEARIAGNSRLPRSGGGAARRSGPLPEKGLYRRYKFGDLEKAEEEEEEEEEEETAAAADNDKGQNEKGEEKEKEEEEEEEGGGEFEAEMDAISIVHMLDDEVSAKGAAGAGHMHGGGSGTGGCQE